MTENAKGPLRARIKLGWRFQDRAYGRWFLAWEIRSSIKEDVALELSLEGFIYPETGVRKDKQRARDGKGNVMMGTRQQVFQEKWILGAVQESREAWDLKPQVRPDHQGPQV